MNCKRDFTFFYKGKWNDPGFTVTETQCLQVRLEKKRGVGGGHCLTYQAFLYPSTNQLVLITVR
jgi:hypothetical protein